MADQDRRTTIPEGHSILPMAPIPSLEAYVATGGCQALENARKTSPAALIAEVKRSGLRGRGGAGFPTGVKWGSIASDPCPVKYLACNASEGEPGTFKDRMLMCRNPYQLLEGVAIAAYAVNARRAFIGMKASFEKAYASVSRALQEMTAASKLGEIPIELVRGPEDYLFGEEKALLEVIEGHDALPRESDFPPYIKGLFVTDPDELNPTVVNNAETLSNIPHIILHGADWFRSVGSQDTPGTMVFTVSGDVQREGIYELPLGTPMRALIEDFAGGPRPGRRVKAILSGVASASILPSMLDLPLEFGALKRAGSGLGSGGLIVYDDAACMVRVAWRLSEFLFVESCGQCTSCKSGTNNATNYLQEIVEGRGGDLELEYALTSSRGAPSGTRCFLPAEHAALIPSLITHFQDEFAAHYHRGCRTCAEVVVPKMHDYDEDRHTFSYVHTKTSEEVIGWHP